jgi:hypothetical protein
VFAVGKVVHDVLVGRVTDFLFCLHQAINLIKLVPLLDHLLCSALPSQSMLAHIYLASFFIDLSKVLFSKQYYDLVGHFRSCIC